MTRWHRLLVLVVCHTITVAQLCAALSVADALADATAAIAATTGNSSAGLTLTSLLAKIADKPELKNAVVKAFEKVNPDSDETTDPELSDPYGKSPPVYPSPQAPGSGEWEDAFKKARELIASMKVDEKIDILIGQLDAKGCSGFTGSVKRLGFPGICLNDAESGVRTGKLVNGYPAQIHVGASWNKTLALERARFLGREFKAKGANVLLGPVVGPLGRVAKSGRNWEGFTNDPYLAGALVAPTIQGYQESVIACVKHLIANEQETNRLPPLAGYLGILNHSVSSNVDDRTMHELYLWPFYDAVKAGVGSVMCAYNRVNNSYACQNSKVMNGYLKTELGFQGFVVSDWNGQQTGIASANAGLDMAMPNSRFWGLGQLKAAVANGSVSESRLDDMVTRVLAAWYRFAPFEEPGMNKHTSVDARDEAAAPVLLQSAVEGHVLVKNVRNALPLKKPQTLSVFGYDAIGGSNTSATSDDILYGFGLSNAKTYTDGRRFTGFEMILHFSTLVPPGSSGPEVALDGTLITGGGSGAITPVSATAPFDAISQRAALDGTTLYTDFKSTNPQVKPSDACLVFVNALASEAWDRSTLADEYSDNLILNVASKCKNTIVVIHNAGIRLVDRWIEHENVTGVIFAHLPGQESGTSLVEILYGHQSPSGRLPYTVARKEEDYGSLLNPTLPDPAHPFRPQSNFTEGLYIDYKHFIEKGITPRFEFGYGLTYTNFTYSNLSISKNRSADKSYLPPDHSTTPPEGGLASLYDVIATVEATVKNTGSVTAAEVAQLYVGIQGSGVPKALRGFDKQLIRPGESVKMSFPLRRRDLSKWDIEKQQWVLPPGPHKVMVGKSVLDIQLEGELAF